MSIHHLRAALVLALSCAGCVLAPKGLDDERAALARADQQWSRPLAERALPELPAEPAIDDLLRRAELASPELESAWQDWRAALSRVVVESSWPDASLSLSLEQMFPGGLDVDRTKLGLGFDPMLTFPTKVAARGRVAFDEARASGERFRALRVDLRLRVRVAWQELWMAEQQARAEEELVAYLGLRQSAAQTSVAAGESPRELLRLQYEYRLTDDEKFRRRVEASSRRARLNALLGRSADAPLSVPATPLATRELPGPDAELFALAARHDPELAVLAHETAGRADALELARSRYLPDITPMASATGTSEQSLGVAVGLPLGLPGIRAEIEAGRAALASLEARRRGRTLDAAAELTAELLAFHEAERTLDCCENLIEPLAQRIAASAETGYAAGTLMQRDWLESLGLASEARLEVAQARVAREIALARIEALLGGDLQSIAEELKQSKEDASHG